MNNTTFCQESRHNKWIITPDDVLRGLAQDPKMDHKKKLHNSHQTLQLLPIFRCKFTAKADIESSVIYHFYVTLLAFENPDAIDRKKQEGHKDGDNACFSMLTHEESLMRVEQKKNQQHQ